MQLGGGAPFTSNYQADVAQVGQSTGPSSRRLRDRAPSSALPPDGEMDIIRVYEAEPPFRSAPQALRGAAPIYRKGGEQGVAREARGALAKRRPGESPRAFDPLTFRHGERPVGRGHCFENSWASRPRGFDSLALRSRCQSQLETTLESHSRGRGSIPRGSTDNAR